MLYWGYWYALLGLLVCAIGAIGMPYWGYRKTGTLCPSESLCLLSRLLSGARGHKPGTVKSRIDLDEGPAHLVYGFINDHIGRGYKPWAGSGKGGTAGFDCGGDYDEVFFGHVLFQLREGFIALTVNRLPLNV